ATDGQAAPRGAGFEPNAYTNVIFAFPRVPACSFSGLGQIGGRFPWLNGGLGANRHELGHNLSLRHSHLSTCSDEPVGTSCTRTEYGDRFDVMGSGGLLEFHGSYRLALGWIDPSDMITVSPADGAGTIGLYSVEAGFGPRILRIRLPGSSNSIFVERREAIGPFDSGLRQFPFITNGVPVYVGGNTNFREQSLVSIYGTGATTSPLQFEDSL